MFLQISEISCPVGTLVTDYILSIQVASLDVLIERAQLTERSRAVLTGKWSLVWKIKCILKKNQRKL